MTTENTPTGEKASPHPSPATERAIDPALIPPAAFKQTPRERLLGVDLARAVALLGMMAAHFGASTEFGKSFWDSVGAATHGRSYILFVFLAGVSLSLAHGGTFGLGDNQVVRARAKLLVRAVCIAVIGSALVTFSSDIAVILPTYAAMFVIAIFFLSADSRTLSLWGLALLVIGGFIGALAWFLSYAYYLPVPFPEIVGGYAYPLLPLTGVLLLGMRVGRTDLSSSKIQLRLLLAGTAVALVAYSSTMLFPHPSDSWSGNETSSEASSTSKLFNENLSSDKASSLEDYESFDEHGNPIDQDWQKSSFVEFIELIAHFGQADPHTGSPAEMFGGTGIALVVLAICLLAFRFGQRVVEVITRPLVAMGSMPLTIYVVHVFTHGLFEFQPEEFNGGAWVLSAVLSVGFAGLWKQRFARGPLEACIAKLTTWFITAPNFTRQ